MTMWVYVEPLRAVERLIIASERCSTKRGLVQTAKSHQASLYSLPGREGDQRMRVADLDSLDKRQGLQALEILSEGFIDDLGIGFPEEYAVE